MDDATAKFLEGMKEPTVPYVPFEEYSEQFKDAFVLTRKDGICEVRMHTKHESAVFGHSKHHGWSQILKLVGEDPENEVVIIAGTGENFVDPMPDGVTEIMNKGLPPSPPQYAASQFGLFTEGTELIKSVVNCIHVPTIGVVNGPAGAMSALALLCDISICSDTATFEEPHFGLGLVPADGNWQTFRGLAGVKRSAYLGYSLCCIDAETALDWGLVNEVVPFADVYKRAWELAEKLMKTDKYTRRITHNLLRRYYRKFLDNFEAEFGFEGWGNYLRNGNMQKDEK